MPLLRRLALSLAVLAASPTSQAGGHAFAEPTPQGISPSRARTLAHLVRHDCGSCHGLTLRGGLGPPLTPDALSGKPVSYLKAVILDGRPGSAMPHWRPLLAESDAQWIAEALLRGVPDAQ